MGQFVSGLVVGWLSSLVLAAVIAALAYRRFVLLERRTQQAERMAELGLLTGGLAHEIKNPLSTVQLNLQLLKEDLSPVGADDAPARGRVLHRLETVHREASRLRDILDDFLRYAGKLELAREPVELNGLLEELMDFFSPQAHHNRIQLRLKRHEQDVVVCIDAKLIKQALLNLMLNAVQAMTSGGEIIMGLSADAGEARIDVIDTGPGIPAGDLDRVFQAYYSKKKGGTGLGLAMARRIVEEHGGRITLRSELGKGSNFTIHLPLT
jgi:signal transduction histidine kinase